QPSLVHLRRHKYQDVLLRPSAPAQPAAAMPRLTLTFNADGEVDELAARAREVAPVRQSKVEAPANTPWNTRDLRATDPEGNALSSPRGARTSIPRPRRGCARCSSAASKGRSEVAARRR